MSASIHTLPLDLTLLISDLLPNLWGLARTNKYFFRITADATIRRAKTPGSFSDACHAIHDVTLLSTHNGQDTSDLFKTFYRRALAQINKNLETGSLDEAKSILQIIKSLPPNTPVHEHYVLPIADICRTMITRAIENSDFKNAKAICEVTKKFSFGSVVPECFFLSVAEKGRYLIARAIAVGNFKNAKEICAIMKKLPHRSDVPKNCFSGVVVTGRDILLGYINRGCCFERDFKNAKATLQVIRALPSSASVPKDCFGEVLEKGREQTVSLIKTGSLNQIHFAQARATLEITDMVRRQYSDFGADYFEKVEEAVRNRISEASQTHSFEFIKAICEVMEKLPATHGRAMLP